MATMVTTGQIAKDVGVHRSKIDYAIEKAGIQPRGRAGIIRLFSTDQISVIEAALATIKVRRRDDA